MKKEKIINYIIALLCLSIAYLWIQEPYIGTDTGAYINMQGDVPPIYPLFLLFLRRIFGEGVYMYIAVLLQTVFAAFAVTLLCDKIYQIFSVNRFWKIVILLGMLSTYFKVDEYSVNCNLWILTEGLSYSLFFLFVYFSILFVTVFTWKNFWKVLGSTVVLTMCRAQFIVCFVMIFLYCFYWFLQKKVNIKQIVICCAGICAGYVLVGMAQNGYKLFVNDQRNWSITERTLAVHLFHYALPEDAELITDEGERQLFLEQQKALVENEYNYRADENWLVQIERYKDGFERYGHIYYDLLGNYVKEQGIEETSAVYEAYARIIHNQLPALKQYFGKWLIVSTKQLPATLARGIFLYYPPMGMICIVYTLLAYGVYLALNIAFIIKTKGIQKENIFCLFVLLFTLGNGVYIQTTVVSIMRYVTYSHGIFYVSGLLVFLALYQRRTLRKETNEGIGNYSGI